MGWFALIYFISPKTVPRDVNMKFEPDAKIKSALFLCLKELKRPFFCCFIPTVSGS